MGIMFSDLSKEEPAVVVVSKFLIVIESGRLFWANLNAPDDERNDLKKDNMFFKLLFAAAAFDIATRVHSSFKA